jgi:hypothetical protein
MTVVILWTDCRGQSPGLPKNETQPDSSGDRGKPVIKKMENSGNEAKKSLKTKESRFLNAAQLARFARRIAQIRA